MDLFAIAEPRVFHALKNSHFQLLGVYSCIAPNLKYDTYHARCIHHEHEQVLVYLKDKE